VPRSRRQRSYAHWVADDGRKCNTLGPIGGNVVVDTDRCSAEDVARTAAVFSWAWLDCEHAPASIIVVGGEYGSEGKGKYRFFT